MDKKPLISKWLVIGIILSFVGTCIIPSTAQHTEKPIPTSKENWLYVEEQISIVYSPEEEWNKTYEGHHGNNVFCTDDGGYVIGGETGDIFGKSDYLLFKVDSNGNELWRHNFARYGFDQLETMAQTTDGGYILLGVSEKEELNLTNEVWLVRTNNQGNLIWDRILESIYPIWGCYYSIQQTIDNGFIIASPDFSNKPHIVKINYNGDHQWNKSYDCLGSGDAFSVVQTYDGGYAITGVINNQDIFIIKTDLSGNELWRTTFTSSDNFFYLCNFMETSDYGFIISQGFRNSTTDDSYSWIIKTDLNGSMEWNITIRESQQIYIHSMQQTFDGGFIFGGYSVTTPGMDYGLVVRIDNDGHEKWRKMLGEGNEFIYDLAITPNFGYILTGFSNSYGLYNVWLVKLSPDKQPQFEIRFNGPNIHVTNIGNANATNVQMRRLLEGGFIMLGKDKTVSFPSIVVGETKEAKMGWIFGLGRTKITISITCFEGVSENFSCYAIILLFFIRILG